MRFLLITLLALCPFTNFAQSSLTIFSEDGYRFYLVLNGQKQNNVAMTNVRIDGLAQPQYAVKILFEDPSKPEISKNIPVVDPGTNAFADVTYKIKTNKDGELKMRYFSATPVVPNYVPPADVYVMHYGQPAPPPPPGMGGTTVTQTTVTQTTGATGMGGANISVGGGMGGVNMNINISDPVLGGGTTTTTRTTTTTTSTDMGYSNGGGYNDNPPPPPPPSRGNNCRFAMDASSFRSAKETVTKASFDETKLSTAKTILTSNCMSTDQVIAICNLFSFEASKLDFAKYAYERCTDRGNYFKVGNIFSFDASRTELNEYISGH
ncbi:MAG: DUF4476 domain-containing protein [Chitinophagaceae bacterium]|nr:DUF4476 domain-containing protein [Chitinophagaceae bacterium]